MTGGGGLVAAAPVTTGGSAPFVRCDCLASSAESAPFTNTQTYLYLRSFLSAYVDIFLPICNPGIPGGIQGLQIPQSLELSIMRLTVVPVL